MKILGFDVETQGLEAKTTPITEIGAILVTLDLEAGKVVDEQRFGQLVYHPGYPPQDPKIVELTGITDEMLKKDGIEPREALAKLLPLYEQADIIMAHNKEFDQTVLESVCARLKIPLPKKEWICTVRDVPYAAKYTCKKLSHLAFDHGMQVDISKLHRALDDVSLMLEFILRHYSVPAILEYARIPWVVVQAQVSYEDREKAKARRYSWEKLGDRTFPKSWVKQLKQTEIEQETKEAPFPVRVLKG